MQTNDDLSMPSKNAILAEKDTVSLDVPTSWPGANARLLDLGLGLPVNHLDRLRLFSADEFERFILEWAEGYLKQGLRSQR